MAESAEPRRWTLSHGQMRDGLHINPEVASGDALACGEVVEVMPVSEHEQEMEDARSLCGPR